MNKYLRMNSAGTLPYVSLNSDNSLTYDYPILSDTLNPAVWDVVKLQGWNSNPDYLTKLEAAAVTSFPDDMFNGNTEITSFNELVYFTSLTALSNRCFRNCPNLVELTLPPSMKTLGIMCFGISSAAYNEGMRSSLVHIYNLEQIEYFNDWEFQFCLNLSLNPYSFRNFKTAYCQDGQTVIALNSYKIEDGVYKEPINISKLYLPNAEIIKCQTFFRTLALEEVYIGNNCTLIESYTFGQQAYVYNLGYKPHIKKIDIGTGITEIHSKAVNLADEFEALIIRAVTPPTFVPTDGDYSFGGSNNTKYKIYVPDASVNAYKAAEGWSNLADKIFPLSQIEN